MAIGQQPVDQFAQQAVAQIAASYGGRLDGDPFASNLMTQLSSSLLDN